MGGLTERYWDGSSGESGAFFAELDDALTEAILSAELSKGDRQRWQKDLKNWQKEVDNYGVDSFAMSLAALQHRLKELAGNTRSTPQLAPGHRRLSKLGEIASTLRKKRQQKEQNAARKKRIQELEALAPKEAQIWKEVVRLIELKQAKPYDEATALLKDLRDLAEHQGRSPEFSQRFEQLKSDYQNRPALITRFKTIKV